MQGRRRYVVWSVGAVAVAALVAFVSRPRPVEIDSAKVERGPLRVTIDEEGETRLRRRFIVSAPVAGRVQRIDVRPGDAVRRTQPIAVVAAAMPAPLDARARLAAEARVGTAEASLAQARAEFDRLTVEAAQANREADRVRSLLPVGAVAREDAEVAETRAASAKEGAAAAAASVRAAEASVAEARAALSGATAAPEEPVTVRAPIDGLILRRVQESEAVLPAGAPLVEIGNLADLEVVADLLSSDAVQVKEGASVIISRWGGNRDLSGRVSRVEPSGFTKISALGVEEQRVNTIIQLTDPPAERASLGDGFRVEVHVVVAEAPSALLVPTPSLFRVEREWSVFVVRENALETRRVQVGRQNDRVSEVLGGLVEGETVVMFPGESLTEGTRVVER